MPNESLLPLCEAAQAATGRRPHLSTLIRWCTKRNRHGVRLESWMVGGRRLTSIEAVRRYVEANTTASDRDPGYRLTNRQSDAAHAAAMRELEASGL